MFLLPFHFVNIIYNSVKMTRVENEQRRKFLIGAGAGLLTATGVFFAQYINTERDFSLTSQEAIRKVRLLSRYKKRYPIAPDPKLIGTAVNIPFTPYDQDKTLVHKVVQNMQAMGTKIARVYIPDSYEPKIGMYDRQYTDELLQFIEQSQELSNGNIQFIVSLFDTYRMLHSHKFNPIYGSASLNHPYLEGAETSEEISLQQQSFFLDEHKSDAIIARANNIISSLLPVSESIAAWEIANEPEIPFESIDKVDVLTEWYAKIVPRIRNIDPDTAIVSGLKNPMDIYAEQLYPLGLDHNSAHIYGGNLSNEQKGLTQYIDYIQQGAALPPALLLESSFPRIMYGLRLPLFLHDAQLARSISDLMLQNVLVDNDNEEIGLPVPCYGIWQLETNAKSQDGFHFDPDQYPRTTNAMNAIQSLLTVEAT